MFQSVFAKCLMAVSAFFVFISVVAGNRAPTSIGISMAIVFAGAQISLAILSRSKE